MKLHRVGTFAALIVAHVTRGVPVTVVAAFTTRVTTTAGAARGHLPRRCLFCPSRSYRNPDLLRSPKGLSTMLSSSASTPENLWEPNEELYPRRAAPDGPLSILALVRRLRDDVDESSRWRALAATGLSLALFFRRSLDRQLAVLWTHLMTGGSWAARAFRTDSYEWCLAVAAFAVWIHGFWLADRAVDEASRHGRVHPWRKYRLQDRFEADQHRRRKGGQLGKGGDGGNFQPEIRTKQSPWNNQGWMFELWVYVLPLLTWDVLAPRRHRRLAPFGAPTTVGILGGVALGLLLYDCLFFCGHVVMHRVPWIYRTVHAKHHKIQEVRAGDIVRLSLVEEVLEVGFSIVALNLLSVHPLARSLYNVVITFLLTELHCGFDFPWSPQNVVPFGLVTGSRRHHYHHRNGRHYYQKFFFTFDRLFGFYQHDDGTLHGDSVKPNPYVPPAWQSP